MVSRADAVVVGGGILGASTAHFLARSGFGTVVLIDKGRIGRGSTAYSAGHIRQHYSNEVTIRLAVRGLEMFENDEEQLGGPTSFRRCGYMVVAPAGQEEGLRRVVPLQRSLGVHTELVTGEEIRDMFSTLATDDIALGAWEPQAGYADPVQTVESIARSAEARWGLVIEEGVEVIGIGVDSDRVTSVETTAGEISTGVVVNCAGPWAPGIARMVGLDYDFSLSREHEGIFRLPDGFGPLPVFSDAINSSYFRPAGDEHVLVGEGYPKEQEPVDPDDYDDGTELEVVRRLVERLTARIPSLADHLTDESTFVKGYSGVYDITADWNPTVGPADGIDGYFAAAGGSGHCFKIGPPIGEALAGMIAGSEPAIDISPLGHGRFATTELLGSVWGPGNRA